MVDEYDDNNEEEGSSTQGLMIKFSKNTENNQNNNNGSANMSIDTNSTTTNPVKKNLIDDFTAIFGNVNETNTKTNASNSTSSIHNIFGNIDLTSNSVSGLNNLYNKNVTPTDSNINSNKQENILSSLNSIYTNSNSNHNNIGFPTIDFSGITGSSSIPTPQLNLFDNIPNNSPNLVEPLQSTKQIFKNNDIVVYSSVSKSTDKTQISSSFYVSNNLNKLLTNVKLNLSVKKHVNCKVLSTSGTTLEPMKSMGIKKDVSLINNDIDKEVVMKITFSYTVDGKDITDSFMYENI